LATAGLKVVLFSAICEQLVKAAGKGLSGRELKVESLKLKGKDEDETEMEVQFDDGCEPS
jgi:hypothetical protein